MASAEQMSEWRSAVGSTSPQYQTAGTTISTTGVGTFNQPDPFMFGYSFVNKPVLTYGAELDSYDPTDSRAIVSQGYTYSWITDDQGLYIGAYIGVRIIDIANGAQATHDFHFREMAVKNVLNTPNVPATYATGTFVSPAAADGTKLNVSVVDSVAIIAPTASPAITAYGMPSSIVLKSDLVDPTVQIEYHMSTSSFTPVAGDVTTLVKTTRSMVEVVTSLPNGGGLLQAGATYYFHALAVNAAGHAPSASAEVTCQLDPTAVSDVITSEVIAGFVLAGLIQVGNITIDPDSGIQIPLTNGGLISLPADGSTAQFLRVLLEATSLLVDDNFELRGTSSKLVGTFAIQAGVTSPGVAPTVTSSWADPSLSLALTPTSSSGGYGLGDDGTNWVVTNQSDKKIYGFDKTTGIRTTLLDLSATTTHPYYAVKLGSFWYLLALISGVYTVQKYDNSWVLQAGSFAAPSVAGAAPYSIGADGTSLYIAYYLSNFKIGIYSMTTTGTSPTLVATTPDNIGTPSIFFVGSADFGGQRFVLGPLASTSLHVYSAASGGTRITAQEWALPNGEYQRGVFWDGTNFRALTSNDKVWKLSPVVTSTARSVRFSKYDSDSTGGTHETAWSPATAFTQKPREWMLVTTSAPEFQGGTDDPNAIRHYIQSGGSGSYWRQLDIPSNLTSALSTGGAITALPVTALVRPIASGASIVVTSGANAQTFTTSATVAAGATSIPVTSTTPNFNYPIGSTAVDSAASPWTALYGAPLTSGSSAVSGTSFAGVASPGVLQSASGLLYLKGDDTWALPGLTDAWIAYTPTFGASTTNPTIGTGGTILGWYQKVGRTVRVRFEITWGSTGLNAGSGTYTVSLPSGLTPVRSVLMCPGTAEIRDSSVPAAVPRFVNFATSSSVRLMDTSGTFVTNNNVYTWATGDTICGQLEYEI